MCPALGLCSCLPSFLCERPSPHNLEHPGQRKSCLSIECSAGCSVLLLSTLFPSLCSSFCRTVKCNQKDTCEDQFPQWGFASWQNPCVKGLHTGAGGPGTGRHSEGLGYNVNILSNEHVEQLELWGHFLTWWRLSTLPAANIIFFFQCWGLNQGPQKSRATTLPLSHSPNCEHHSQLRNYGNISFKIRNEIKTCAIIISIQHVPQILDTIIRQGKKWTRIGK
jgi:hypothetical protein